MSDNKQTITAESADDFFSRAVNIGDALQLQDTAAEQQRYYAKLVGFLNRSSIVVLHPHRGEQLIEVREGMPFMVRGFAGKTIYEFDCRVLGVFPHPYPHLHLSFPEQVETKELRGAMRIKVKLACSVAATADGLKMPATISDLSTSGVRINSTAQLGKVGDTVQVNFKLTIEGCEQALAMSAIIRNAGATHADNSVIYGLEFVGVTAKARIVLQSYVCLKLIDKRDDAS